MSRVKSRNTTPELIVRTLLHTLGLRFRVNRGDLPGSPDIVLPRHRTVIFVHGCFWHSHKGCTRATTPNSNIDYWLPKLERTVGRDREASKALRRLGWRVITVWECETGNPKKLIGRLGDKFEVTH
jgi:DNA mismatch endonuclease (patch repair protein)